jgi:hypothetical protein
MADTYPHGTREYVYPVIRNGTAVVTDGIEFALVAASGQPAPTDWQPAVIVEGKTAAWVRDLPPGTVKLWARITDGDQRIVLDGPFLTLT